MKQHALCLLNANEWDWVKYVKLIRRTIQTIIHKSNFAYTLNKWQRKTCAHTRIVIIIIIIIFLLSACAHFQFTLQSIREWEWNLIRKDSMKTVSLYLCNVTISHRFIVAVKKAGARKTYCEPEIIIE